MLSKIRNSMKKLVQGVCQILDTEFPDFFMVFPGSKLLKLQNL